MNTMIGIYLLTAYQDACRWHERGEDDVEAAAQRMEETWVEWRDYSEEHNLCQHCGDPSPEYALCDECVPYDRSDAQ